MKKLLINLVVGISIIFFISGNSYSMQNMQPEDIDIIMESLESFKEKNLDSYIEISVYNSAFNKSISRQNAFEVIEENVHSYEIKSVGGVSFINISSIPFEISPNIMSELSNLSKEKVNEKINSLEMVREMKVLSNQATETLNEKKNDAIMKTIVLCSIIITSMVLIYLRWGGKVWETKKDSL